MSRLIVDESAQIRQVSDHSPLPQPRFLKVPAHLLSYIFHPLFIPVFLVLLLIQVQGFLFSGFSDAGKWQAILQTTLNTLFLPLVAVLLLRGLKFIDSIRLETQKERVIPYIITMVFYFWNWYVFKNNQAPAPLVAMSLAVFISSILGFMANIKIKISMHGLAMGVMVAFVATLAMDDAAILSSWLALAMLIAGLVGSSRLIVSNHHPAEVYYGFAAGVASQVLANYFTSW